MLACAWGVAAGLLSGELWLDEALSVEIASLPLDEVPDALRQDGAPPLYYVLLKAWIGVVGDGTVAVRALSAVLVPVALGLAYVLGRRLAGVGGGRGAVVVLAALPWTMRYGSEARMYLLVVVLVLAGALALEAVRRSGSRPAVVGLASCAGALLLTHYWALFLLAAVGLVHLPELARRRAPAVRVVIALALGAVAFLPWLPTFLFQAAHTGAPWAAPVGVWNLVRTPLLWGAGWYGWRLVVGVLLVVLVVAAAVRRRDARLGAGVVAATLLLAWTTVAVVGGAYNARYTAVVVGPLAVVAGLGAVSLGRRWGAAALAGLVAVGALSGVPGAGAARTAAEPIAERVRELAGPGDLLVYCPDQLGPDVARLLGDDVEQAVYPTLGPPDRVDWVDYADRNDAADPYAVAAQIDERAAGQDVFLLLEPGYRTLVGDCESLAAALTARRGGREHVWGDPSSVRELVYRFPA